MKKFLTVLLMVVLVGVLVFGGCAKPAPAPAPAPAPTPASAPVPEVITIRSESVWPPGSTILEQVHKPPLNAIEEKSKGRLKIQLFTAGALGKPEDMYDRVVTGKVDLTCDFSPAFTPGRFPLTELLTLPINFEKAVSASEISLAAFDRIVNQDYPDTKTFQIYIIPDMNYCGNKKVLTLADLKGLKIRSHGGFGTEVLKSLGATPVQMGTSDLYLSLKTGVVDGASIGHMAIDAWKLQEVIKYFAWGFSFGSTVNGWAMNKDAWKKIPDDLKPMVEDEIRKVNRLANVPCDVLLEPHFKLMRDAGVEVYTLSQEQVKPWYEPVKPAVSKWVSDMEAKGLPAKKLLDIFREECQKRSVYFPY